MSFLLFLCVTLPLHVAQCSPTNKTSFRTLEWWGRFPRGRSIGWVMPSVPEVPDCILQTAALRCPERPQKMELRIAVLASGSQPKQRAYTGLRHRPIVTHCCPDKDCGCLQCHALLMTILYEGWHIHRAIADRQQNTRRTLREQWLG